MNHNSRQKIPSIRDVDVVDRPRAFEVQVDVQVDDRPLTTADEITALHVAIGNLVGRPQERHLISLLRRIAPGDAMLARLDDIEDQMQDQAHHHTDRSARAG